MAHRKYTITKDQLRKIRKAVLREQFKKEGIFHLWRRQSQIIGNKKAIENKKACRKKVDLDE
jgi:hypothetical protein